MEKSEDNLVAWIASRSPSNASDAPIGIGDDMAMVRLAGSHLLLTTDMLMDGVDFDAAVHPPDMVGRKALAVGLSDCAAMAVRPRWALVSVALPNDWSIEQAMQLHAGIRLLADEYQVALIGGDTNSWDHPLVIDLVLAAEPWPQVKPVTRRGMRPGDAIWVSGALGGSIQGRHLNFRPRVEEAHQLAATLGDCLHAMMDLSDGLSTDAHRMAAASGCGIELDEAALEAVASEDSKLAVRTDGQTLLHHVLNDGEDFELFYAVAGAGPREVRRTEAAGASPTPLTRIGVAVSGPGVWLRRTDKSREKIEPRGWQHFTSP